MHLKTNVQSESKRQVIDITTNIEDLIEREEKKDGICIVFVKHTTAAVTTADLDPGTDLDMLDAFEAMIPKLKYRHPHNPAHVPDHILSSLIGTSCIIPIQNGVLTLGTWQRIVFIELDGPRKRELVVTIL